MKNFDEYKLYVFDLDGTLYDQPRLRMTMAKRLFGFYCLHPFKIKELFLLQEFRKVKDSWDNDKALEISLSFEEDSRIDSVDNKICEYIASKKRINKRVITEVVAKWIYENPLNAIYDSRDEKLIRIIELIRDNGHRAVILSDYPVVAKLEALKLIVDGAYSGTDSKIGELKPSPKGLKIIMEELNVDGSDVIMIGDRMEKDGLAALNAGVDYLILPRKIKARDNIYKDMRV